MPSDSYLHQLMTLPAALAAYLSPDGLWMALTWQRVHENADVFLLPSDGSTLPIALSHTPERTEFVGWSPDSAAVLVREDHKGDERVRLFHIPVDQPGVMQPLTEDRPAYFLRGGCLSPDNHTLFYGANFDFACQQVIEPTWVIRHNLLTGERRAIARPEKANYTLPELNRAGSHIIYNRRERAPAGRQVYLVDAEGNVDREILNFGDQVRVIAHWLPDSETIAFLSEAAQVQPNGKGQGYNSLGIYHWPSGGLRWLVNDPLRSIERFWVSQDGMIIVDEMIQAVHRPSYIDPLTGLETFFPTIDGNLLPIGRAADGAWTGLFYSSQSPHDVVRFQPVASGTPDLTSLTRLWERTRVEPAHLTRAETFHWSSSDRLQIQGWLYRAEPNPRRAIILIHGGPNNHAENELKPHIQYFVSRGFNVLDVNYRGSTGFGPGYRDAIKETGWGGQEQVDIAEGAQALIRDGLADPGRVGVMGTSYGGYSAWFLITHYPLDIIAAAAPICGMTDLVVDYHTTRPDLRPLSEEMLGGSPQQAPERYFERSPIHYVQNIRGKLLIVQGANDPNVTPDNMHLVVEQLKYHHIPYELLVFDDEGHGILKPANQEKLYARLAEFFDTALGAASGPLFV